MINPHLKSTATLSLSQIFKSNSYNTATVAAFISSVVTPSTPPAFPFFICCIAVLISTCLTAPVSISNTSPALLSPSDRVGGGLFRTSAKCSFPLFFTSSSFVCTMPYSVWSSGWFAAKLSRTASNTAFILYSNVLGAKFCCEVRLSQANR